MTALRRRRNTEEHVERAALGMLAVAVLAAAPCRAADHHSPWSEYLTPMASSPELAPACAGLKNSLECARAIERRQSSRPDRRFEREGPVLTIKLTSGKAVSLRDEPPGDNETIYSYIEYLPAIRQNLVHVQYSEPNTFLLVDAATGAKTFISGIPIVSPGRERFVCAQMGIQEPSPIQIWRVSSAGVRREWEYVPRDWLPGSLEWIGEDALRVEKLKTDDPAEEPFGIERIVQDAGSWKLLDLSFSLAFECSDDRERMCVADELPVGVPVVLLPEEGRLCRATTSSTLTIEHPYAPFEAAELALGGDCDRVSVFPKDRALAGPLAVMGAAGVVTRSAPPAGPFPQLPEWDRRARRTIEALVPNGYELTDGPPLVSADDDVAVLTYRWSRSNQPGPVIVVWKTGAAQLEGLCAGPNTLFRAGGRLHLSHVGKGCDTGEFALYVYDLSAGRPVLVYVNGKLGT